MRSSIPQMPRCSAALARCVRVGPLGSNNFWNSYRSCIGIARSQGFCDVAFATIATGIYGFRSGAAARNDRQITFRAQAIAVVSNLC
jgi:O-acetyl-ADP-ribose deacetylase (regulator of RNase III)